MQYVLSIHYNIFHYYFIDICSLLNTFYIFFVVLRASSLYILILRYCNLFRIVFETDVMQISTYYLGFPKRGAIHKT